MTSSCCVLYIGCCVLYTGSGLCPRACEEDDRTAEGISAGWYDGFFAGRACASHTPGHARASLFERDSIKLVHAVSKGPLVRQDVHVHGRAPMRARPA
jgi:hypothetical protein